MLALIWCFLARFRPLPPRWPWLLTQRRRDPETQRPASGLFSLNAQRRTLNGIINFANHFTRDFLSFRTLLRFTPLPKTRKNICIWPLIIPLVAPCLGVLVSKHSLCRLICVIAVNLRMSFLCALCASAVKCLSLTSLARRALLPHNPIPGGIGVAGDQFAVGGGGEEFAVDGDFEAGFAAFGVVVEAAALEAGDGGGLDDGYVGPAQAKQKLGWAATASSYLARDRLDFRLLTAGVLGASGRDGGDIGKEIRLLPTRSIAFVGE